jgi:hypothetical protein
VYIFRISKGAPELGGSFTQMVGRGCAGLFFFSLRASPTPMSGLGRNAAADVDDRERNEEDPAVQVVNQDPERRQLAFFIPCKVAKCRHWEIRICLRFPFLVPRRDERADPGNTAIPSHMRNTARSDGDATGW